MRTRGKGRYSLEKQRIPLGAAKCVFLVVNIRRESVWDIHFVFLFVAIGDKLCYNRNKMLRGRRKFMWRKTLKNVHKKEWIN